MKNKKGESIQIIILTVISVLFIAPIVIVFMNSFKSKLFINSTPFAFPNADSFVGLVSGPCKKPFYKSNVLSVCFCHDRTIPDGNVYAC